MTNGTIFKKVKSLIRINYMQKLIFLIDSEKILNSVGIFFLISVKNQLKNIKI